MTSAKNKEPSPCTKCGKLYVYKSSMYRHRKDCGSPKGKKIAVKREVLSPSTSTVSLCDSSKITNIKSEMCKPKDEFKCNQCRAVFASSYSLRSHQTNCTQHKCFSCNIVIGIKKNLAEHMETQHKMSAIKTCHCCGSTFENSAKLAQHRTAMRSTGKPGTVMAVAHTVECIEWKKPKKEATVKKEPKNAPASTVFPNGSSQAAHPRDNGEPDFDMYWNTINSIGCGLLNERNYTVEEMVQPVTWVRLTEEANELLTEALIQMGLTEPPPS